MYKIKGKKTLFFIATFFAFFLKAGHALALELRYPDINLFGQNLSINDTSGLPEYARYFFNAGVGFAALIAVVVISYGGILYLVSYSRGKFTDEGKEWVKSGILGLLITVCAYLIVYTINPNLVVFSLEGLLPVTFENSDATPISSGGTVKTFQEIPLGSLTETLLTKTMNCYAFDNNGNPVDGETKSDNGKNNAPTYMNHDRVDCLTQLMDGAQKKGEVMAGLSSEISVLMDKCSCAGKCDDTCGGQKGCNTPPSSCPSGYKCTGNCVKSACKQPANSNDCCPTGVKDKIEHGPVKVTSCLNCGGGSVDIEPNFNDDSFENPTEENKETCEVGDLGGIAQLAQTVYIGSNVNKAAVQWAMDQWNALFKSKVFSKIVVSDATVNAYCFHSDFSDWSKCSGSSSQMPLNGFNRIYAKKIDTGGTIPWAPPAYNFHVITGGQIMRWDIDMDTSLDVTSKKYKMTLVHELGHSLGLADSYDTTTGKANPNCNYKSVMNNQLIMDETNPIGEADKTEIKNLYPSLATYLKPSLQTSFLAGLLDGFSTVFGETTAGSSDDASCKSKEYKGLDEFRCEKASTIKFQQCSNIASLIEKNIIVGGETITIIDQEKWNQLTLLQQLTYFKEEIKKINDKVKDDVAVLDEARDKLGKCYLAVSYVDLLKANKKTNQENTVIIAEKFSDPKTKAKIDVSKYCKGFNYGKSSCLKKCNDICPDSSAEAMNLYSKCRTCRQDDIECLSDQEVCIKNAYNERPCVNGNDTSKTFEDCITSCRDDCANLCAKQYPKSTTEYATCKDMCSNDTKCVLNKADVCLLDNQGFKNCTEKTIDQANTKYCIASAYLCKNGSDEYAGYSDCTAATYGACAQEHTASFFYNNPTCLKCSDPYAPPKAGTACYNSKATGASCQTLCPETTKCPKSSSCPDCPCDQIDQTLKFCIPSSNDGKGEVATKKISAQQIVGPQCNEYSYNDDPLTFYCENEWWKDPNREGNSKDPIGSERVCPKTKEIPVGQTIDDAKEWASDTMGLIQKMTNDKATGDIDKMITFIKKIGDAKDDAIIKNYCKCNAKTEKDKPICTTDCKYSRAKTKSGSYVCSCTFSACDGKPCDQLVEYLAKVWTEYKQLKADYINFYTTMLQEPRSDIFKELAYSRKQTNECSLVGSAYGKETKLLSCTRVQDELLPPINTAQVTINGQTVNSYCYGRDIGKLSGEDFTDNWSCCEKYTEETITEN